MPIHRLKRAVPLLILTGLQVALAVAALGNEPRMRWYKGNTHTHTMLSDGDSSRERVTRWYRTNGYHFVVLTDHDTFVPVAALNAQFGRRGAFIVLPGEEVTSQWAGKSVHVNALNTQAVIGGQAGSSPGDVLRRSIKAIGLQGGVSQVNHPNFEWSLTLHDLRQVPDHTLLEIYSGHPWVNNDGSATVPNVEALWDGMLSDGAVVYGVAVDDAHNFRDPKNPIEAGPGRGWVVVRAAALEPADLMTAMARGDFYASNGVEIRHYVVTRAAMSLVVRERGAARYRIQFIGKGGEVLQETSGTAARYTFRGTEAYVRAKVIDSDGRAAWCQPVSRLSFDGRRRG
jgi:hypothetical protein